jgi:hypothetical protein
MKKGKKAGSDKEDFFKVISDFVKGKIGHPDMSMAKISWDGETPPPLPEPLDMNPSFGEIASQHPVVANALKRCAVFHTASPLGGLLTLPELQANGLRLEALVHLSVMLGKGKERPTPA